MRKIGVNCCVPRARAPHQSGAAAPQARKKLAILRIYAEFRVAGLQLWLGRTARDHSIHVKCHKTHTLMHATYARQNDPAKTTHRISALPSRNPAARLHSFAYASARASALPAPPRARLVPCLIDAAASTPPRDTHGPADHDVPPPLSRSSAFVGCRCIGWPSSALTAGSTPARCRSAAARENGQCQ